jgi:hypothetical protein
MTADLAKIQNRALVAVNHFVKFIIWPPVLDFKRHPPMLVGMERPENRVGDKITKTQYSHPRFNPRPVLAPNAICRLLFLVGRYPSKANFPLKWIVQSGQLTDPESP